MDFLKELEWRGMLQDTTPGTEEFLAKGMATAYIGFDPTADSLHIGNLVQIMTLMHFQRCGHKPMALVGGATGMVGDPSGKTSERQLLDEDVLRHNQECIKKQLENFLDFGDAENSAELVNNYDWFRDMNFLEFIREVGKHITINYMLAKDSVQNRLETGLSFTEFTYQLVQGYDFYYLKKNKNCLMQMGGSDQWGNMTTGTELIRRMGAGEAYATITKLITKADGSKFGKSEEGNVWLDPKKTSPYKFYQFWLNASDEDVARYIRIFSTKSREEIESMIAEHEQEPHRRLLQHALADEVTERTHSPEALEAAKKASNILFGKSTSDDLRGISEGDFLDIFSGVGQAKISRDKLSQGIDVVDLLSAETGFLSSKGEARRFLQQNAISVNKEKVDPSKKVDSADLINEKYVLLQRGKKKYFLVIAE